MGTCIYNDVFDIDKSSTLPDLKIERQISHDTLLNRITIPATVKPEVEDDESGF